MARGWRAVGLGAAAAAAVCAQTQPTFYAAYEDGVEFQAQGQWRAAIGALERAVQLRPAPAARVIIYGNNLLTGYYPYHRIALCHLELGEQDAAAAALRLGEARGEPAQLREPLLRRLIKPGESGLRPEARPPEPAAAALEPARPAPGAEPAPVHAPPVPSLTFLPEASLARPLEPAPAPLSALEPQPAAVAVAPAALAAQPAVETLPPLPMRLWGGVAALGAVLLVGLAWRRRRPAAMAAETQAEGGDPAAVGPYQVLRRLGHGGSATTYLARHRDSGREVAVKVMHPHRHHDPDFRRRFAQEARLGALLDHPRLVRILDPGPPEGASWIAMEYIPGPTLEAWLQETGPLALDQALDIALGLAEAMAYAHSHGVVHRDLKPGNVILGKDGVKVMDLGIARDLDALSLTTTYSFLGTPLYAAPEAQLVARAGPAVDRYSLGAILFEMLAGHPPFGGETPFALLEHHRSAPVPDIRALREVPPELVRLLERLLAKDPEQRPEDGELVKKLQQIREQF